MPKVVRERRLYNYTFERLSERDIFSLLPDLDREGLVRWSKDKALLQIASLQEMGRLDGFTLMVLCIPYKEGRTGRYDWLHEGLEKDTTWFLDLSQDSVWVANKASMFFKKDYHLTKEGNRILATKLYEALKDRY